jgi:hypothetical protein
MTVLGACAALSAPVRAQHAPVAQHASHGTLIMSPAVPVPGTRVRIAYLDAGHAFDGIQRVVLRARLRRADDDAFEEAPAIRPVAVLDRHADGRFRGAFLLPADVVYARFSVEDSTGRAVDAKGGAGWEMLTVAATGQPRIAALRQQRHEHFAETWDRVDGAVAQMVRLYPDSSEGRALRWRLQRLILPRAELDTARASHRARLASLEAKYASLPAPEIGQIAAYARLIGDSVAAERWGARVSGAAARTPAGVEWLASTLQRRLESEPQALLDSLETLWPAVAATRDLRAVRAVVRPALAAAAQMSDAAKTRVWASRVVLRSTNDWLTLAEAFVAVPALRPAGIDTLSALLQRVEADPHMYRPFSRLRSAPVDGAEGLTAYAGMMLAQAHVTSGDSAAARRVLAELAGRIPRASAAVSAFQLQLGDTLGVVSTWGTMLALVETPAAVGDSVRAFAERIGDGARLAAAIADARDALRTRANAGQVHRVLPPTIRLRPVSGAETTLKELAGGMVTLVVYWSRSCGFSLQALPAITAMTHSLASQGVRVLLVTAEASTRELAMFAADRAITPFVVSDARGELERALTSPGTPSYFLLDHAGVLRYDRTELNAIAEQVNALRTRR